MTQDPNDFDFVKLADGNILATRRNTPLISVFMTPEMVSAAGEWLRRKAEAKKKRMMDEQKKRETIAHEFNLRHVHNARVNDIWTRMMERNYAEALKDFEPHSEGWFFAYQELFGIRHVDDPRNTELTSMAERPFLPLPMAELILRAEPQKLESLEQTVARKLQEARAAGPKAAPEPEHKPFNHRTMGARVNEKELLDAIHASAHASQCDDEEDTGEPVGTI